MGITSLLLIQYHNLEVSDCIKIFNFTFSSNFVTFMSMYAREREPHQINKFNIEIQPLLALGRLFTKLHIMKSIVLHVELPLKIVKAKG